MSDVDNKVKMIVEGLLLAAGRPLTLDNIIQVFARSERPDRKELKAVMAAIEADCDDRGFELKEVASGYRFQVKQELSEWVAKLWEERPPRYTRALLETLALITYRQPITRGDIEEIRGVAVSPNIIRTLLDREWVRVVGHRDVPGRPAMFATTKQFLDYFNLKSLQELPPLSEIKELVQNEPEIDLAEELAKQRVLEMPDEEGDSAQTIQNEQEMAELIAEEEALELAKKPLDEILAMPGDSAANDEEDIDDDDEEDEESEEDKHISELNAAVEASLRQPGAEEPPQESEAVDESAQSEEAEAAIDDDSGDTRESDAEADGSDTSEHKQAHESSEAEDDAAPGADILEFSTEEIEEEPER